MKKGEKFRTSNGICEVAEYINTKHVIVRFIKTGTVVKTSAHSLNSGKVKDRNFPVIFGRGYLGEGEYSRANNKLYALWYNMMTRCYSKAYQTRFPTYIGCKVIKRWFNFQEFCKDITRMKNWNAVGFELDKDLRSLSNKIYSPKYCSFVPSAINLIITGTRNPVKTEYTGVTYTPTYAKKYRARVKINEKVYQRRFDNPKSAHKYYMKIKLKIIKEVVQTHKRNIHTEVYNNIVGLTTAKLRKLIDRHR